MPGQVKGQQATLVDVFTEGFERSEFSGYYIVDQPTGDGFEFFDDIDFTYNTALNGQMANDPGKCIITTNSDRVGHGTVGQYPHPAHSGSYYLFAVSDGSARKIYTKTVPVVKGELVEFGVYYRDVDGGYSFRIEATGDGVNNTTVLSDDFSQSGGEWKPYTLTIRATNDGNITFNIIDKWGSSTASGMHKFGIDDITVTKKAILVTSPASLIASTTPNTAVPIQAKYNNPLDSGTYDYEWQKYNGSSWITATGSGAAVGTGTGDSFTTSPFSVTESTEGYANYRLSVTVGSNTYYSDIITIEYTSTEYIFKEDFGGNWTSTASTTSGSSLGASADWWIMPGYEPAITTDFTYGQPDTHNGDNRPLAEIAYGQRPIKLDNWGAATYAITKLAGWNLPIPNEPLQTWKWGDGDGGGKGSFDDHTIPDDDTRGYFMYASNMTNTLKTVYEKKIPVTTDMLGQTFSFSAWQVALWGRNDGYSYQFKLEVENASNTVTDFAEFKVSDEWAEKELLFYIPNNYSGSSIKIRISSFGDNLWMGLDDISLTKHDSYVTITSPLSGSTVGSNVNFTVDYKYISPTINYKWQKSDDGSSGWTDITNAIATGISGTFTTNICPVQTGYYRVLITDGNNLDFTGAMASTPIELTRDANYLFKEDFGGTSQSNDTSKDWWIIERDALSAGLQGLYNSNFQYTPNAPWFTAEDIANHPYGMDSTLYLFNDRFAITKVSGKMAELYYSEGNPTVPVMLTEQKTLYDHTTGNGIGYYMMSRGWEAEKILYKYTQNCLSVGNYSFNVWLASTSTDLKNRVNLTLQVEVGSEKFIKTVEITTQDWTEYSIPFYTDGTSQVEISIISAGDYLGNATFGVDDITLTNLRPRITKPDTSEIDVIKGESITLEGEYKYVGELGLTVTYKWETSTDGVTWTTVGIPGLVPNEDKTGNATISPTYLTDGVNTTVYYRLVVEGNGVTLESTPVKITPVDWPKTKTYWICPDNVTDEQIAGGYRPSLIYLEIPEIYGLTYKWYDSETGTDELQNLDYYDPAASDNSMLSDDLSYTFSALNQRNTSGVFNDKTYWVEICDAAGVELDGIERIPIYLKQAYICASIEPKVSKETAHLINRENFGGTSSNDDPVLQSPPQNINIDYNQYTGTDNRLPEGSYMVTKTSPTLPVNGDASWYEMKDHVYDYDNGEYGYLVAVNATEEAGRLYTYQLANLGACRNVELVFSGWFASPVNWNGTEKANLKFILTNPDTGEIMSEFVTGNMIDQDGGRWRQFGFKFYVPDGVTNISLQVLNNNFGTRGGNDVVMDDIEIYLAMPPVSLTTLTPGVVCGDPYGTLELKGEYRDDGTLGKDLDYRWEYRKDESSQWNPIPDSDAQGSSTTGVITNSGSRYVIYPFTEDETGDYRLVIGQSGAFVGTVNYACLAVSEPYTVAFAATGELYPKPVLKSKTAFCYDDIAIIDNEDENSTSYGSYTWLVNGIKIQDNNDPGASPEKLELSLASYDPGYYTISLQAKSPIHGCTEISTHNILIFPKVAIWTAKGDAKSWNDNRNWDTNVIPGECTDVIIPNDGINISGTTLLKHYPDLKLPTLESLDQHAYETNQSNLELQKQGKNDGEFSLRPACDTITFKMGGGVARTDYLKYNFANVDLDIKPNRWYTVSAPLRAMYSGDYFVAGNVKRQNPTVFMMKYNATNPQTTEVPTLQSDFSNPFNTLTEDLYPGLGYAIFVDDGNKTPSELQPFRFPKDSLQYTMWNYHGVYLGKTSVLNRSDIGRFTYEKVFSGTLPATNTAGNFNVAVQSDRTDYATMLIGNPFMSHLSFSKFAEANTTLLDDEGYYIWTGETYQANMPGPFLNDPDEIAPMQSFIMKKRTSVSIPITSLSFSFNMSVTSSSTAATLRTTATNENSVLRMDVLRDNIAQSNIRLRYNPTESNEYNPRKDMWTLFSEDITYPAVIYTLLGGKATSIRTLGDLSEPVELGIRTDMKGELTLRLSGMESLDSSYDIYLEDRLTGEVIDMREKPKYTFNNMTGDVQGRFFLKIGETGLDNGDIDEDVNLPETDIRIFTDSKQIVITSPTDDPIELVKVYSLQGQLLLYKEAVKHSFFSTNSPIQDNIVLVYVITKKSHQKKAKLIIR